MTRALSAGILVGLAVSVTACGRPALRHLDGHALAPDFRFAAVERGWIAVDSCAAGLHAVVELEVDSAQTAGVDEMLLGIGRALQAVGWRPVAVTLDGPICSLALRPPSERPRPAGAGMPAVHDRACAPVYLVRAQYRLRRLPGSGEQVTVRHLDRRIVVQWDDP